MGAVGGKGGGGGGGGGTLRSGGDAVASGGGEGGGGEGGEGGKEDGDSPIQPILEKRPSQATGGIISLRGGRKLPICRVRLIDCLEVVE